MQKITELNHPPVIGEIYLVPCLISINPRENSVPIFGEVHDDDEIGVLIEHVHPDFRFFNHREFRLILQKIIADGESLHSLVYRFQPHKVLRWEAKKCCRATPPVPVDTLDPDVMELLEHIYRRSKLNCGICPHKGANLNSIAPDENGNKVCPLHYLMWGADGSLVPRFGD